MNILKYIITIVVVSSFLKSNAQTETYSWHHLEGSGWHTFLTGFVSNAGEEGLFYTRSHKRGAYRWSAQDNKWISLLDWVPETEVGFFDVGSIATDPKEPNRLYLLVGSKNHSGGKTAILRSSDYGDTFETIDVSSMFKEDTQVWSSQTGEKLAIDPNHNNTIFCGTSRNGLFRSDDFGTTWNKVISFPTISTWYETGISFVLIDPTSGDTNSPSQTIIVGVSDLGSNKLFISKDGGLNFSKVNCPTTLLPHRATISTEGKVYIAFIKSVSYLTDETGAILEYDLNTAEWSNRTPPVFDKNFADIVIDPDQPNRIVAATISNSNFYLSIDKGISWKLMTTNRQIPKATAIRFDPYDSQSIWVSTISGVEQGNIEQTSINWTSKADGLNIFQNPREILSIPNNPLIVDKFVYPDVHGASQAIGLQQMSSVAASSMTSRLIAANDYRNGMFALAYSANRGSTWSTVALPNSSILQSGKVALSADGMTVVYCPADFSPAKTYPDNYFSEDDFNPLVTHDLGKQWIFSKSANPDVVDAYPVADPVNSNKFYIFDYERAMLHVSKDRGQNFTFASHLDGPGSRIIRAMPDREGDLWIALNNEGLARSINSGAAFSKVPDVSYCSAVGFGKKSPHSSSSAVYIWGTVDGVTGIFRSLDEGASWQRINDDLHQFGGADQFITGDVNVFGRVYINTNGRGIMVGESSMGCEPTPIKSFIKVGNNPVQNDTYALFFPTSDVTLSPEPTEGGSWSWKGPAGFESTNRVVTFSSIDAEQGGLYKVTYTDPQGCESATQNILLESTLVTATEDPLASIEVYPNPAAGSAEFRSSSTIVSISILDYTGKIQAFQEYNAAEGALPISGLPSGLYILNVQLPNQNIVRKRFIRI